MNNIMVNWKASIIQCVYRVNSLNSCHYSPRGFHLAIFFIDNVSASMLEECLNCGVTKKSWICHIQANISFGIKEVLIFKVRLMCYGVFWVNIFKEIMWGNVRDITIQRWECICFIDCIKLEGMWGGEFLMLVM